MPIDLLKVEADFGMVDEWPLASRGEDVSVVSKVLLLPNRPLLPVFTDRSSHNKSIVNYCCLFHLYTVQSLKRRIELEDKAKVVTSVWGA